MFFIDHQTNQIVWKWTGPFSQQNDVDILDDHRISIFNNNSINVIGNKNLLDGNSEVIIYNVKQINIILIFWTPNS